MATTDEVTALRALVADPNGDEFTDEQLAAIIDSSPSLKAAAASVWTMKAAKTATLVNVSESGSSRSLGDLHQNALRMAKAFEDDSDEDATAATGIRIRRISRP